MPHEFLMFWLRETTSNIARNRLMSVLAVTTVTVALFILGAFFLVLTNLQALARSEAQKIDLVVFLKADVTPQRRRQVYEAARLPPVAPNAVADLQFVSKAQVLREQKQQMPDIPMEDFGGQYNPYSDELRLKLKDEHMGDIIKVKEYLDGLSGVLRTRNDWEPVRRLLALRRFLAVAGLVSLIVLGMAILLIIHNAIRLTIFARRRDIRIMELVGATPWFIRVPLLMEGVIYGVAGALVAALVLGPLYAIVARVPLVRLLLPLAPSEGGLMLSCGALMLAAGLAFGVLGSWLSLSRSIGKAQAA